MMRDGVGMATEEQTIEGLKSTIDDFNNGEPLQVLEQGRDRQNLRSTWATVWGTH